MKTKVEFFVGYPKNVAEKMNEFFQKYESSGNNMKILHQTQTSNSQSGYITVLLTYQDTDFPRRIPTKEEIEQSTSDWRMESEGRNAIIIEENTKYQVRQSVLNLPQHIWEKMRNLFGDIPNSFVKISVKEFYDIVGKDGGFLSGKLNDQEKIFCEIYYNKLRREYGGDKDANVIFNES